MSASKRRLTPQPLTGAARVAAIIGWPVSHSLSPRLHGYWLRQHSIDGAYVPLAVRPEDLPNALAALPKLGFAGANVTVPHKQAAVAEMDVLSDAAIRIGAVNTIVVEDGRLLGDNTDGYGFIENLRVGNPQWRPETGSAVLIGAGGSARAVLAALLAAGAPEVRLINRTMERAEALAQDFGPRVRPAKWESRNEHLADAALLVNATTEGMAGRPPLSLDLDALPKAALVTDLVYVPLITPLLAAAAARGNPIVDGLGMLLHQARPGFARWFGVTPEVTPALRTHMLAALAAK